MEIKCFFHAELRRNICFVLSCCMTPLVAVSVWMGSEKLRLLDAVNGMSFEGIDLNNLYR